ncbi:MAG: hypothetical protein ACI97A_001189 [Planctomycetota bacterium]|jgi:hypothetical protein
MKICTLVLLFAVTGTAQKLPSDVAGVQIPQDHKASGVAAADINRDGRLDLVVTTRNAVKDDERFLRVHFRQENGGFKAEADHQLTIHKDFTAFLVADVLARPGLEVVLFSGARAVAWVPEETGRKEWVSLFRCPFMMQLSRSGRMIHLPEAARDLNGDGKIDFLIPMDQGYGVFIHGANGAYSHQGNLLLPPAGSADAVNTQGALTMTKRSASIRFRLPEFETARSGKVLRRNLVQTTEWNWRPRLVDFDGDGALDLLARGSHKLFLWRNVGSRTKPEPDEEYEVPVVADRSRLIDIAYSSHFIDLNGDKKIDSVMIAGDQRSETPRTQILVFQQGSKMTTKSSPLFGAKGIPSQLLVLAGFTGATDFRDVNGDGKADLIIGSLRQDIIDKLRESAREKTEVELYVYFNQGGGFSKSPDIRQTFEMKLEGLKSLKSGFLAKFIPDVTGDGIAELATRTRPDRLDVHYLRKMRNGALKMLDKPLWSFKIDKDADLFLLPKTEKEAAGVLVVESKQVTVVRF